MPKRSVGKKRVTRKLSGRRADANWKQHWKNVKPMIEDAWALAKSKRKSSKRSRKVISPPRNPFEPLGMGRVKKSRGYRMGHMRPAPVFDRERVIAEIKAVQKQNEAIRKRKEAERKAVKKSESFAAKGMGRVKKSMRKARVYRLNASYEEVNHPFALKNEQGIFLEMGDGRRFARIINGRSFTYDDIGMALHPALPPSFAPPVIDPRVWEYRRNRYVILSPEEIQERLNQL